MADFSDTQIQPVQSAVTPPRPVEDRSGVIAAQGSAAAWQAIGQGVGNAFDILGNSVAKFRQGQAQQAEETSLTSLLTGLGKIDQARRQGKVGINEAGTLQRNLLIKIASENPGSTSKLTSTYNSITGKEGFGQLTPEEKAFNDAAEKAAASGLLHAGMSETQRAEVVQNTMLAEREGLELERTILESNAKKAQMDLSEREREQIEFETNQKKLSTLNSLATKSYKNVSLFVAPFIENSGTMSAQQREAAKLQLEDYKANLQNDLLTIQGTLPKNEREIVSARYSAVFDKIDLATRYVDGTESKEILERQISILEDREMAALYANDPALISRLQVSKLSPVIAGSMTREIVNSLNNYLLNPGDASLTAPGNAQSFRAHTDRLARTQKDLELGKVKELDVSETKRQVAEGQNGVVESLLSNSYRYKSGKELKGVVEYLAGPDFKKHATSGEMDTALGDNAIKVIGQVYSSEIMPKVEEILSSNPSDFLGSSLAGAAGMEALRSTGADPQDLEGSVGSVRDMVDYKWVGDRIVFTPKDDRKVSAVAAKRLNDGEVGVLVSQVTRAYTHLLGESGYEKVFTEMIAPNIGLKAVESEGGLGRKEDRVSKPRVSPNERIAEAFGAVEEEVPISVETESFSPVDVPTNTIPGATTPLQEGLERTETGDTEVSTPDVGVSTPQAQEVAPRASMSRADITKAARAQAQSEGYEVDSREFIARSSALQRQMLKEQKKVGQEMSKALSFHAQGKSNATTARIPKSEVASYVKTGLEDRGIPSHIADAFLLNFQDESGLNPDINERNPIVEGSRGGYGLYQLTGPRRKAFEKFAEATGREPSDIDAQLDWMMWELENTESKAAEKIFSASSTGEAAEAIVRFFLRPLKSHQDARAKKYRGA